MAKLKLCLFQVQGNEVCNFEGIFIGFKQDRKFYTPSCSFRVIWLLISLGKIIAKMINIIFLKQIFWYFFNGFLFLTPEMTDNTTYLGWGPKNIPLTGGVAFSKFFLNGVNFKSKQQHSKKSFKGGYLHWEKYTVNFTIRYFSICYYYTGWLSCFQHFKKLKNLDNFFTTLLKVIFRNCKKT